VEWTWVDDVSDGSSFSEEELGSDELEEPQSSQEEQLNDDSIPTITHSVAFKSIGHLKELRYQELLAMASSRGKLFQ